MKINHKFASNSHGYAGTSAESVRTTTTILAICVGSAFFILVIAAATCYYYRRRSRDQNSHKTLLLKKSYPTEKHLVFKKPTAVKSCAGSGNTLLKKSPSPTGQKSPPGINEKKVLESKLSQSPQSDANYCVTEEKIENVTQQKQLLSKGQCEANIGNKTETVMKDEHEGKENLCEASIMKLGNLHFKLKYNYEKRALCVTIIKCTDLVPKDHAGKNNALDPYVKLQLLPEKQHKVKTRVLRKTQNPVYDEDFTFYGINPNQLQASILHFVVLSFDRYSRDDVIGEVFCQLNQLTFDTLEKQIFLEKEICPRSHKLCLQGRGEILISLCYQPTANRLTIVVLKARNLPKMDFSGYSGVMPDRHSQHSVGVDLEQCRKDPYVKIYLLHNNQRIVKKRTHVKKKTINPVFNESFVFDVPYNEGLENVRIEFQVLDYDRVTKNEVIGKLELGPRAIGTAQKHWSEVISSPRRQIAEWHKLN